MKAVVKLLRAVVSADKSVKCLVFSHWDTVLIHISDVLNANNLINVCCTGQKASGALFAQTIEKWKIHEDINVIVLYYYYYYSLFILDNFNAITLWCERIESH